MKKLILTVAVVMGLTIGSYAQGGLFERGAIGENTEIGANDNTNPLLPAHGQDTNQPATPLGSGALLLLGFGAAYAISKRNKD